MTEERETLAGLLNLEMVKRGWNQRELADAIGLDPSRISRVLAGRAGVAMTKVPALAEVLDRDPTDIAGLIYEARFNDAPARPLTLTQRVESVEEELSAMRSQVAELTAMLEKGVARKLAPKKATGRKRT